MILRDNIDLALQRNQWHIDFLIMEIERLEEKKYYETKKRYLKRLLTKCATSKEPEVYLIPSLTNESFHSNDNFFTTKIEYNWATSNEKELLLKKLINLIDKIFLHQDDQNLKLEFRNLELQLSPHLDAHDILIKNTLSLEKYSKGKELRDQIKLLCYQVSNLLGKKIVLFSRDLRQSYRNIIKFRFKNMDDESAHKNVLKTEFFITFLDSINSHLYGQEKNCRKFRIHST